MLNKSEMGKIETKSIVMYNVKKHPEIDGYGKKRDLRSEEEITISESRKKLKQNKL